MPPDHIRPSLTPQRKLAGNFRMLVYQGLHLRGTEDQLLFGELVYHQLSVVIAFAPARHPSDHIVLADGQEGRGYKKLRLVLLGEAHRDVVRRHGLTVFHREDPQVLLVVESIGVSHVICAVDFALNTKEIHGIAPVREKPRWHFRGGFEKPWKNGRPRTHERVIFVGDVKVQAAVIGIHDNFNAISNVIDPLPSAPLCRYGYRFRVGITTRNGIGVLNPEQPPFGDHEIWVAVITQEWRHAAHALVYRAVEHYPALGQYHIGKKNPRIAETGSKQ